MLLIAGGIAFALTFVLWKEDPEDGYLNTVTVTSVTGEIPLIRKSTEHPGKTADVLRMVSEKDYPSLAPRSDTANTPVQVLVPGYTLEKIRITEAPVKEMVCLVLSSVMVVLSPSVVALPDQTSGSEPSVLVMVRLFRSSPASM